MPETVTPVRTPTIAPDISPEPLTPLDPDRICPAQKEKVVREIERVI